MNKRMVCSLLAVALLAGGCGKQEAPASAEPAPAQAASLPAQSPADLAEPAQATPAETAGADSNPDAATDAALTDAAAPVPAAGEAASSTAPAASPSGSAPAVAATAKPQTQTATPIAPAKAVAISPTAVAPAPAASAGSTTSTPASAVSMNGDPGTLVRADTLRARNAADAPEVAALAAGAKVRILARDGAWYQVNADGKTGWVRMMSVRRSAAASADVAGLAGIASGRTGTGKVVTTTGVRGLDSGDLTAATFDEARIARAESLRVTRADAEAFARQAGLAIQTVPALPAPAK